MFNLGGLVPLSRLRNWAALAAVTSSPIMIQPKLVAGLETHDCTSAIVPLLLHVKVPRPGTKVVALTVGEKSPPGVVHRSCFWELNFSQFKAVVQGLVTRRVSRPGVFSAAPGA